MIKKKSYSYVNFIITISLFIFGCSPKVNKTTLLQEQAIKIPKKCTVGHEILKDTTKNNIAFMYGSMGGHATLNIVYEDFINDTIPYHKLHPSIHNEVSKWKSYTSEIIKTDSGIIYNMYNMEGVFNDSIPKQIYFMSNYQIDSFYQIIDFKNKEVHKSKKLIILQD